MIIGKRVLFLLFYLVGGFFLLSNLPTKGQISISLKAAKREYLTDEVIKLSLTLRNYSGNDIHLTGPANRGNWLTFDVQDSSGHNLSSYRQPSLPAISLDAGQTTNFSVVLNQFLPLSQVGNYRVVANIFSPLERITIKSNAALFTLSAGVIFWQKEFGVGNYTDGSYGKRKYALINFQRSGNTELFVRIRDEKNRQNLNTISLGRLIRHHQPQAALDTRNNLHLIYNGAPTVFGYVVVSTAGKILSQQTYYQVEASRPILTNDTLGNIRIRGGIKAGEDGKKPASNTPSSFRKLSQRPKVL